MYSQETLSGWVKNQSDKRLENVIIRNVQTHTVQYTDANGFFEIEARYFEQIEVAYLGYETRFITMDSAHSKPVELTLKSISLESETVMVYGKADPLQAKKWVNSIDDVLQSSSAVQMVRRANFSQEPMVRGLNSNALSIKIDGMYVYPACVDHMDPVTNYVEVENLERITLNKSNTSENAAATIDMITNRAAFNTGFQAQADLGFESVSNLQKVRSILNMADSVQAFRLSVSHRKSGDYYAANHSRVEQSQYEKWNYMLNFRRFFKSDYQLDVSFIGDDAYDIGYPALIMDATKAQSRMLRFSYADSRIDGFGALTLYYNQIDHWMDDYQRDVTQRSVMPNMFMPMFGYTRTAGGFYQNTVAWYNSDSEFKVDYHRLEAFADMEMIPLDPAGSDAYVLNIGDALSHSVSVTLNDRWFRSENASISTTVKLEQNYKFLENESAKNALSGFWNQADFDYSATAFSFNVAYETFFNQYQFRLSYGRSERIPSHQETYAFFLYNPIDDYFYTGNPNLKTEKSHQVSGLFGFFSDRIRFKFEPYVNLLNDYVYGVYTTSEWKLYQNLDRVFITGFESEFTYQFSETLETALNAEYTYGYNEDLDEPLLMITPFNLHLKLVYANQQSQLAAEFDYYAEQERIAFRSSEEDQTKAYQLVNFRYSRRFLKQFQFRLGVENIFDSQYHSHLSVNNLAGKGRNLYLGLNYEIN